ncbi:MAG: hypothetical protein KDK04_00390, partial [Candidatus Competibacteraceae bacterium]|nr:hypothetical protein [Candidatus Competibacteraceae bacterium]
MHNTAVIGKRAKLCITGHKICTGDTAVITVICPDNPNKIGQPRTVGKIVAICICAVDISKAHADNS